MSKTIIIVFLLAFVLILVGCNKNEDGNLTSDLYSTAYRLACDKCNDANADERVACVERETLRYFHLLRINNSEKVRQEQTTNNTNRSEPRENEASLILLLSLVLGTVFAIILITVGGDSL